jgi:hypothetical protein
MKAEMILYHCDHHPFGLEYILFSFWNCFAFSQPDDFTIDRQINLSLIENQESRVKSQEPRIKSQEILSDLISN